MGNSSLLNSHALQFIGQVCSCCKGSVLLSLSLSSMFKQDMDWWMTFQAKLSARSLFHCDSYAPSTKSLCIPKARGSNHSSHQEKTWIMENSENKFPNAIFVYTTPLMTFVLLSIYSNPFALPKSSHPNLLLLWSSTAKLQRTIPWRSVNGRCWSKRLKLLQLFEIQPAEMRFRGLPNSKTVEQTKSCKESWPLTYMIYIYMYICMAFCGLRLVLLVGQLLLVVLLFEYQQHLYYYSTISTSTTSSSCL